jgi:hypothetical protein
MRYDEILGLVPGLKYRMQDSPGLWLFLVELLFWAVVVLLTVALFRLRPRLLENVEVRLVEVSQHQRFWRVGFALLVVLVRLALLPLVPIPAPVIHDEFSYLLASDTFAHGRLTNPASPMWMHFESFHINVQPTYQSMYPPAQGMALALGQKLTGIPWTGVLLTTAIMCSAIYWMLLGWMSPSWAWLGGVFACARFGIFSYWMNSYWGGSVAAIGGALVLGALPRLRSSLKAQTGLILAAGLLILANSRPLEGLLFSIPILISAAIVIVRSGRTNWRSTVKAMLPAAALLVIGAGWMLYYNWRGTGNALLMPYYVNFKEYHISNPYLFQKPNPIPQYRHLSMRTFYVWHEYVDVLRLKYAVGYLVSYKANAYYAFFAWPFLLLMGPGVYAMWHSEMRVVLLSLGLLAADLFSRIWPPFPQYVSPALGAIFLLFLFSLRRFRSSRSEYAIWGSRAAVMVLAVWFISPVAEMLRDPFRTGPSILGTKGDGYAYFTLPMDIERERIQSELTARSGKHLVIVRYPLRDLPGHEWVYNEADIDQAKVIWARDMGYWGNQELVNYYPDRQIWYVDRGDSLHRVLPYDQVTAPVKLAFELAALDDSRAVANGGKRALPPLAGAAGRTQEAISAALPR